MAEPDYVRLSGHEPPRPSLRLSEGDQEVRASTQELFMDLAIVAIVSHIAEPLHEATPSGGVDSRALALYSLRCFLVWWSWHQSLVITHATAIGEMDVKHGPVTAHALNAARLLGLATMAVATSNAHASGAKR